MIGTSRKLSFDKANQIFSYFLKSIQIVHDHDGEVPRIWDFVNEMAAFCGGDPAKENGEENRAWYNKSLFPRYYGFLDIKHTTSDKSGDYILSTPLGEQLFQLIEKREDASGENNENTLYIPTWNLGKMHELFYLSLTFNSFGRNNTGAEQSVSDVDPPKVMMKVIYDLNGASKEEICYCIYGLHRGAFTSLVDVIRTVNANRSIPGFSYSRYMEEWRLENISNDFKLAKLLVDPGVSILNKIQDEQGNEIYVFSDLVPEDMRKKFSSFDGVYHAMKWMFVMNDISAFPGWVRNVVAGSTHNDDEVFITQLGNRRFSDIAPNEFTKALVTAFSNPQRHVYFSISADDEGALRGEMGEYIKLLDRVDDFRQDYNGWSKEAIEAPTIYQKLLSNCSKYRGPDGRKLSDILGHNMIQLPSNFHFIGGVQHA